MDPIEISVCGSKAVEVPYFANQLTDSEKSVLIVGERWGAEGISPTVKALGYNNVTTTDILSVPEESWLKKNTTWNHIQVDFVEFDETLQYDYVIAISVFEHFGFWFAGNRMANGLAADDLCRWNHDIRGISKACKLLKNLRAKLIITLPAGPYMNCDENTGEPFLRSYDCIRQKIVRTEIKKNGCFIADERFFFTSDYSVWQVVSPEINNPANYKLFDPGSPNTIWGLTIQKHYSPESNGAP
jgi:hypothetical protein